MAVTSEKSAVASAIRPFKVDFPQAEIDELRRRIAATRLPTKELVDDRSQGVKLATIQEVARYWENEYDWRKVESKLNALPQFTTEIDGVEVHFIHVKSQHEDALPLIMTHGWPGSVVELVETVGPLSDPTAHGGTAEAIGYGLLDSPIALAAWMIDHDTDAYRKITAAFVDGKPSGNLTRDHILDDITLYWLTGTGASAARSYWEAYGPDAPAASARPLPATSIPFAFTTFPGEIWRTPRSWVEHSYPNVIYFNEVDKGGHFAAWEEPELFTTELRAAFRSLRNDSASE